jgi:hypothetical protein
MNLPTPAELERLEERLATTRAELPPGLRARVLSQASAELKPRSEAWAWWLWGAAAALLFLQVLGAMESLPPTVVRLVVDFTHRGTP